MSRSREPFPEIASARSEFASEESVALNRPQVDVSASSVVSEDNPFLSERDGFESDGDSFVSEGDSASLVPMAVDVSNAERGHLVARDSRVWAKSFAPVKTTLWPLAIAVVAVMAVERVTMWKVPVAAPTKSATAAATDPPTAATASPTVAVASAPATPGVVPAAQQDRRTIAGRVASLQPAPMERSKANALTAPPPAQPAANLRPAQIELAPMSAPAFLGIAAKAPSIEMMAPELPAPIVTETVVVSSPLTPVAVDLEAIDKAAIDRVLGTYQQSYSALDAAMVSTIWRGLDTRGLQRAFDGLDSQRMSFEHCEVTVADDKARASCTGVLDYVRKIGQTNPLQKRLSWNFDLQRTDDRWLISKVDAR